MDLQVYAIILIVFLVSFLSYLFISRFLPHGKTFDEMIAEKKRMREEVLGTVKSSSGKQSSANAKKKPKKEIKKKEAQSKVVVIKEITSNESDVSEESSEANRSEPATPSEVPRKQQQAAKAQANSHNKKSGKSKSGILINKNEPVMVKEVESTEEVNHFVETHPKDAVEIHRGKEEDQKNIKNFRETKKSHKQQQQQQLQQTNKETPPVSPKNQPVKEVKIVEEKITKKKKSEQLTASMNVEKSSMHLVTDETGISPLIRELSRADLTKNQIQVLIDFLLNKQSDTTARDPTEWSEGKSDVNQKLKKQLLEKEAQLKNEQDALSGMQIKLKELRAELNTEKIQSNATLKAHVELIQNCKTEIKTLQSEIQFLNEKHNNEKQTLNASLKQLQAKFLQASESLKTLESLPNAQQLQNDNQMLQQDIVNKNQQIMELNVLIDQKEELIKQKLTERDNKLVEYDVCLRKKDESCKIIENELRQRVQDITNRDNEIQKLSGEILHVKEILQRQTIEMDQLKKQISDHHHQNNHAEENNKIEIRNLQNALDSSKKELESQHALISDYKKKIDDLNKQLESKSTQKSGAGDNFLLNEKINEMVTNHQNIISEKDKQLVEYQKQILALQKAEQELSKQIEEQKAKNNTSSQISIDEKKIKELLLRFFPDTITEAAAATDKGESLKWLESVLENLKTQLASNKINNFSSTTSSSSNANHLKNNCSGVETNNLNNNSSLNGDSRNCSSSVADNELILLQNAQLKTTVEEYKNIIAETESMLKNLESKVREQDSYWTKVVLMKDNEIENLKSHAQMS